GAGGRAAAAGGAGASAVAARAARAARAHRPRAAGVAGACARAAAGEAAAVEADAAVAVRRALRVLPLRSMRRSIAVAGVVALCAAAAGCPPSGGPGRVGQSPSWRRPRVVEASHQNARLPGPITFAPAGRAAARYND